MSKPSAVRWIVACGVVLICALTLAVVIVNPTQTVERIEEDDPRWDCKTMGNRICGYAGNLEFTCPTGNGNRTPQELDLC